VREQPTDESDDPSPSRPVEVTVAAADAELVADELFGLGASAVSERPIDHGRVVLVADVDPAHLVGTGWEVRVLEDDPGWHTAWHDTARAWTCGDRLEVRPHWVDPDGTPVTGGAGPDRVQVVLDPGTAFGAGSHPTTRLCLAALEPLAPDAGSVLDVGCGTGVLGVAALLLGAHRLTAIDVDPEAVVASERAVVLNGLTTRAQVSATPLERVPGSFDLVLANLLLPVVEQLGAELVRHLAPGGSMVVSGVLSDQLDRAVAALAPLVVQSVRRDGEWVAAVLSRR
jgi:ribosomal protein L11 methyltransferase